MKLMELQSKSMPPTFFASTKISLSTIKVQSNALEKEIKEVEETIEVVKNRSLEKPILSLLLFLLLVPIADVKLWLKSWFNGKAKSSPLEELKLRRLKKLCAKHLHDKDIRGIYVEIDNIIYCSGFSCKGSYLKLEAAYLNALRKKLKKLRKALSKLFHIHLFIYDFRPDQSFWYEFIDLKTTRKKALELVPIPTNSKPLAAQSQQSFFHYEIHQKSNRALRAA